MSYTYTCYVMSLDPKSSGYSMHFDRVYCSFAKAKKETAVALALARTDGLPAIGIIYRGMKPYAVTFDGNTWRYK